MEPLEQEERESIVVEQEERGRETAPPSMRQFIKFSHDEVEALLNMLNESSPLSDVEKSAREKLKKIYARQILSHEKWERTQNEL